MVPPFHVEIIYGLSRCTVVVASDHEAAGGVGNSALVEQGAVELSDDVSLSDLLGEPAVPASAKDELSDNQLTLGF